MFDVKEMEEIRSFRFAELPVLSVEVETYIQELANSDPSELYTKVNADDFAMESDLNWIQKFYQDTFRLLRSGFFSLGSQTEANLIKRVWPCVDTCFDFSNIRCAKCVFVISYFIGSQ